MLRVRVIRSGSGGNAVYVQGGATRLLVDVGLPAELVAQELVAMPDAWPPAAILLTHEHEDHARGAWALARQAGVPVLATEGTLRAAAESAQGVSAERVVPGVPVRVGEVQVEALVVSHDAAQPVGYVISRGPRAVLVATDLGAVDEALVERSRTVDALVVEANYDLRLLAVSPYPWFLKNRILSPTGHLSNDAAAGLVVAAAGGRLRMACLVHLSDINNLTPLARDTALWALEREGITGVRVEAVRPNGSSSLWDVG
ncbi:MAG: MBL fold metallo-hydrolase [Armatimonadota bacterium]|nr:MBL fold metallo-hydrolase [Armatimonadota bacterium]MDR7403659.1 MBL fold metallo-hydrolase [Armatimonadota bacterium]MDR7471489.1 MBL fold metallo-hydrolase [Armatimonadota bacterium]MDR7506560.1 MBL fold metallo-hydrolase [Armatimonadota bacterium]MDR7582032.1 MBL fold metallo-hydrolase [Armatimonadota bacterium]